MFGQKSQNKTPLTGWLISLYECVNPVDKFLLAVNVELAVDIIAVSDGSSLRYKQLFLNFAKAVAFCKNCQYLAFALGEAGFKRKLFTTCQNTHSFGNALIWLFCVQRIRNWQLADTQKAQVTQYISINKDRSRYKNTNEGCHAKCSNTNNIKILR